MNDRTIEKAQYSTFVTNMLTTKDTMTPGSLNVGMSIPSYFRHKDVESLFKLYDQDCEEPSFVAVDFVRAGVDDTKRMGIANKIVAHYNENNNENYFLYGLNLRTFKRSGELPISDEMLVARRGFNGFGSPHYRPSKRRINPTTEIRQLGRVFVTEDYHFHPLTDSQVCSDFENWAQEYEYQFDLAAPLQGQASRIRGIMKKYNVVQENEELSEVSQAIRKNDCDILNDKKSRGSLT